MIEKLFRSIPRGPGRCRPEKFVTRRCRPLHDQEIMCRRPLLYWLGRLSIANHLMRRLYDVLDETSVGHVHTPSLQNLPAGA